MQRRALLLAMLAAAATGCATKVSRSGARDSHFDPKYLLKGEIDRVIDTTRAEVLGSLLLVAEKLYRRNPREWRRGNLESREAALERLKKRQAPAELEGKLEGPAAMLAFREDFAGDRVAALMIGLLSMLDAAFEHKEEFFMFDKLDAQKLYNCARNFEIALWKLNTAKNAAGEFFLLANEVTPANPNLSFEREFGRMIGQLDLLSQIVADANGRMVSRLTQSIATSVFLPIGF